MVASSMSITGMSSLIGYTRLQVAHLRAVPFFTRVTGVLQFGHANISRSSGSTAMRGIYDTPGFLWNNSYMKLVLSVAILSVLASSVEAGQTRRPTQQPPAPPTVAPASQTPDRVGQAYEQVLRARMMREDDVEGAIAAYKRAMALDATAADVPADLADLYMDEGRAAEAIAMAEQALKISPKNLAAHRVLGMVYAQMASGGQGGRGGRGTPPQDAIPNAIAHLEQSIENPPNFGDFSARAVLG